MWPKSSSAALLLCGSLLLSAPVFVAGQATNHKGNAECTGSDCSSTIVPTLSTTAAPTGGPPKFPDETDPAASPAPPIASGKRSGESSGESSGEPSSNSKPNTGAIAGGVVGGVLALALIGFGIFILIRRRRRREDSFELEKSPPASAAPDASSPTAPSSQIPPPHQQPISPSEGHSLMSHYGDSQPQNVPHRGEAGPQMVPYGSGEVIPVVGAPKPYAVGSSREIEDDEISIDPPSPATTPKPERQQQTSVPRLPIYQSPREDGDTTPGF